MQKTYWWRIGLLVASLVILLGSYIGQCDYKIVKCFGGNSIPITRTVVHFSFAIFAISIFLFFTNNNVFLKWLRFSIVWVSFSIFIISATPEYRHGLFNIDPEKELVSIWLSLLFVIISLGIFVWSWVKKAK
ncbi:MAG TPA: hypothetical protein DCS28_01400 [Candidatus Moranbacteria bacterium]|nr:hypothetical protein [Candidatus Moranbacteria bacterium]HAT74682.1 hypothetical protein [Candidatus Moranbacteria bacterium]